MKDRTHPKGDCDPARRDWPAFDLDGIRRRSIQQRQSKVSVDDFGRPGTQGAALPWKTWLDSLPRLLAAEHLRLLLSRLRECRRRRYPMIWLLGGHVVKTGLAPYVIDLMERGYITALAMNGAAAIHDAEIALCGRTSEDVASGLADGSFGMAEETGDFFFAAYRRAEQDGCGMAQGVGRHLEAVKAAMRDKSVVHAAWRLDIPCTIHVAVGTDIIHQQPGVDGGAVGRLTYRDFLILAEVIRKLDAEGMVVNVGSAVIMPEVFLKALTMARNRGVKPRRLTTVNLDMIQHYRPRENILSRPTAWGGEAIPLTGHHEIMIPLLHALLVAGDAEGLADA